jgi:hypothetical protein
MNVRRKKVAGGNAGAQQTEIETTPEPDLYAQAEPEPEPDVPEQEPGPETSAPARARFPMPWGNVITDVFRFDVEEVYAELTRGLMLGDGASEYGAVLRALDHASRNAYDAARLVRAAKIADESFGSEIDERLEVLRTTAREQLEQEKTSAKADGKAAKAPTLQEIADRMLANWPDEMRSLNGRRGEMHGAFRSLEALEKAWWDRCATLRTMADRFQAGRG